MPRKILEGICPSDAALACQPASGPRPYRAWAMTAAGGEGPKVGSDNSRLRELLDENERLRLAVARLEGELRAVQERLSAQDAADEHHRAELEVARAEAAEARAELRDAQARMDERRRQVAEAHERLAVADHRTRVAEQERAAVIAALGRRARKHLEGQ